MSILTLSGVCKKFGALTVTDNASLKVAEGQALGIIGPNGAGKSTLFNLITGALKVDAGRIEFDGKDISRLPARQRCLAGIGRSFQIPQPFAKLTVFENLLVAACHGRKLPENKVENDCIDILLKTELMQKANALAGQLSLLERKRLELARALATKPRLLLLDEIAGGLTEAECLALVESIKDIQNQGVTIVWIEHVLHALNSVVDQLLVLNFGKVIGVGEPAAIMASREVQEIYLGIDI